LTGERVERRLAAVLAADVVGYSRLMGVDEEGTLARLKVVRKALVDPTIAKHRGRIVKTTGDGMLVEFASAVDAVRGAVEVQHSIAEQNAAVPQDQRIEFRIGIHVGDIIIDDNDIFGDGVNIAARLEGIAEPGGICVSGDAYRQVRGKVEIVCDDLGPQSLKNIAEPIQAWRVRPRVQTSSGAQSGSTVSEPHQALPLPEKPSIAVLPFQNLSGDPDQEYFADGMVEDITGALSRFKSLFVIARNSSFTYKGKAVDIKKVGRELGVRYVLEGSVRKAGGRVRITGQLIDAITGSHIWADKFDRKFDDVFSVQDEVTEKVVAAIEPKLKLSEIEFAVRRRPDNLSAYDLYLRALPRFYSMTRDGLDDALQFSYRALDKDPRYGAAALLAMSSIVFKIYQGWGSDVKSEFAEAMRVGSLALAVDSDDPDALAQMGRGTAVLMGDYEAASQMVDRAVALNPNSVSAWTQRGWVYRYMGEPEVALNSFARANRLSPLDPMSYDTNTGVASTLIILGRFDEAVVEARKAVRQNPAFSAAYRCLAAALAHLGRKAEAKDAADLLMKVEPSFRISEWIGRGRQWQTKVFIDGLRLAGLPE
jgi:adenylate cyclase